MSYEEAEESDTWSYSSMVTQEDLQIQVSTLRSRIDELRSELQEKDTRISRLENDKYRLQRQDDDNRATIKKLEDTILKLRNDHKDQESLQELLKEKDQDIQNLSDTNKKYENRLRTLEKEERAWSQKSDEMEKEIRKLKKRIQSFKESCCCKQSQVDVYDQNRRNADRTKDVTSPIRQIDNKMKDEDLYEEGKSIPHKDDRREARKKSPERDNDICENCNIRNKTGTLSSCKHELCRKCLDVMCDRKVWTDQKSHKKKVTCSCLHCAMKVSLNEVENLLMTLAE